MNEECYDECPCKQCITYAMCKSRLHEKLKSNYFIINDLLTKDDVMFNSAFEVGILQCPYFSKFIKGNKFYLHDDILKKVFDII